MALCGASKRGNGEPCKRHAIPGSSRCKLHGGKSSGPKEQRGNKNAAKPGSIYSQFLTDEENDILASIELGRVDDELRLTRVRLMRALARENEFGNELEIDSEKLEEGEKTTTSKVRDYSSLIDRLTARVESLERTKEDLETRRLTNEKLRRELNPPKEEVSEHAVAEYTLSPDEDAPTSPYL
ncbi:HGGxSTG domain-containing protein [Pseudomonas sp. 681]|uniref:HGGxSTG domain-containing protein n=1 Tax=Pseudomonas fungipugnans TaxID=3024217 RepID=A0ABT6QG47_9PSED|nr:HGGxSTG domain-containing protein [Pseudomonas sp. 681]MDI2589857.1 HGGxSTG domain-containing protein [Pseudomonas sp. 681]